jgi:hypothetical protein
MHSKYSLLANLSITMLMNSCKNDSYTVCNVAYT